MQCRIKVARSLYHTSSAGLKLKIRLNKWTTVKFLFIYLLFISVFWNRHGVDRLQAHTICTTQIDKNRNNKAGTEFAKKLWWRQTLLFALRWRHHVHSTVVRPFCKSTKMGAHYGFDKFWWPWPPGYAHRGGIATSSVYNGAASST